MIDRHSDKEITANTDEVLKKLRANREAHAEIVVESRKGFVQRAREALSGRLDDLAEGKVITLEFSLQPPQDHTRQYDLAIAMLELHQNAGEETIALKAADVQQFILDDWTWMDGFLLANAGYSGKSRALALTKGLV